MVAVNGIGSTNDSIAWDMCDTGQSFKEGRLNPRHHFMGDDAYTSCEQMLVPYSGKNLTSAQDAYNFAQSSVRIEIEDAFGLLKARWGILWRPLKVSLKFSPMVVMTCCVLHNLCINRRMQTDPMIIEVSDETPERDVRIGDSFIPEFQSDGASDPPSRGNTRTANRSSQLREDICEALAERGFQRPEVGRRLPRRDR